MRAPPSRARAAPRSASFSLDPLHYVFIVFAASAVALACLGWRRPSGAVLPPRCADPRAVVVGDVHGCAKELRTLLRRVKIRPNCDVLYFTGDLIGKGPASVEALREVRALWLSSSLRAVEAVLGNHEAGFLRWLDQRASDPSAAVGTPEREAWVTALGSDELQWLRERPLHVALPPEFGRVRVVHAGVQPGLPLGAQTKSTLITIRSLLPNGTGTSELGTGAGWAASWKGPEHLVFGHDARRRLQRQPYATGIDSAAVYGGRLTALILPARVNLTDGDGASNASAAGAAPAGGPLQLSRKGCSSSLARGQACLLSVSSIRGSCRKAGDKRKEGKKRGAGAGGGKKGGGKKKGGRKQQQQQQAESAPAASEGAQSGGAEEGGGGGRHHKARHHRAKPGKGLGQPKPNKGKSREEREQARLRKQAQRMVEEEQ